MIVVLGALVAAAGAAIPAFMFPQAAATVAATTKRAADAARDVEVRMAAEVVWLREITESMGREPTAEETETIAKLLGDFDVPVFLAKLGRLPAASQPKSREFFSGLDLLSTADEIAAYEAAKEANDAALAGQLIRELAQRQEERKQVFGA
jgi:hypothetical protein